MILKDMIKSVRLDQDFYREGLQKNKFYFFRFFMFILFFYSFLFFFVHTKRLPEKPSILTTIRSYFGGTLPTFIIENGTISSPSFKRPFLSQRIRNFQVLVDTSGRIQSLKENIPSGLLISQNFFLLKLNYKKQYPISAIQINQIMKSSKIVINDETLDQFQPFIKMMKIPMSISSYSWKHTWSNLLLVFILSAIIFLLMKISRIETRYQEIWKTAFCAMPLALCVNLILLLIGLSQTLAIGLQAITMGTITFMILKKQKDF